MKKIIFALLLLISTSCHADEWLAATEVLLAADWMQTRQLTHYRQDGLYEANPILGTHPKMGAVNAYFASYMLGLALASDHLGEYRKPVLAILIGSEGDTVFRNLRVGLRIKF